MKFLAGDTTTISIQQQQFNAVNGFFTVPAPFDPEMKRLGYALAPAAAQDRVEPILKTEPGKPVEPAVLQAALDGQGLVDPDMPRPSDLGQGPRIADALATAKGQGPDKEEAAEF